MEILKVHEAFAGFGTQLLKIKDLGIKHESVGTTEIDVDAIIAYAAAHNCFANVEGIRYEEMRKHLIDRNIGFNFKTKKSAITRMKKEKVKKLYSAAIGQKCYGDISIIDPGSIERMNLYTYSFPCQDITNNGGGKGLTEGSKTRSSLLWECKKVIKHHKPEIALMENVTNLLSKTDKKYPEGNMLQGKNIPNSSNLYNFKKWLSWLESEGYNNYYEIINAYECGIPQKRKRVFLVSILKEHDDGTFKFEKPKSECQNLKSFLEKNVSNVALVKESLFKKGFKKYYALISNKKIYHDRPFIKIVDNNLEVRQATTKGYDVAYDGDGVTMDVPNSPTRRGRIQKKAIATLTTSCNIAVWTDGVLRYLTARECLRLMGVKDKTIDAMSKAGITENKLKKLAGNSIVTNAMEFIKNIPGINFEEGEKNV